MGPSRLHRSSLSSTEVGFSFCLASELILLFSMTHAATKLIYKPGFFNIFQKLVFAESFSVPVGTPDIAAPSCIHWVTPILDAELNALVVTRGCYLEDASVAYP